MQRINGAIEEKTQTHISNAGRRGTEKKTIKLIDFKMDFTVRDRKKVDSWPMFYGSALKKQ